MAVKRGSLSPLKLFGMLRSISERRMSGELIFKQKLSQVRVLLVSGRAVEVESSVERPALMAYLVERGLLSSTEREELNETVEFNASLHHHLIDTGLVARLRLINILERFKRGDFFTLFGWDACEFTFEERPVNPPPGTRSIEMGELLIEGIARALPPQYLKQFLTGFAQQYVTPGPQWERLGGFYDQIFPRPNLRDALGQPVMLREACRSATNRERCFRELCALIVSGVGQCVADPRAVRPRAQPAARPAGTPAPGVPASPPGVRMSPAGMPAPPSGRQMASAGMPAAPPGVPAPPRGVPASPPGMPAPPSGMPAPPSGMPAPPSGMPAPPSGMPAPPSGIPAPPSGIPAPPSGMPAPPPGMPAPPPGMPAPPAGMPMPPTGMPAPPAGMPMPPTGMPAHPSNVPGAPLPAGHGARGIQTSRPPLPNTPPAMRGEARTPGRAPHTSGHPQAARVPQTPPGVRQASAPPAPPIRGSAPPMRGRPVTGERPIMRGQAVRPQSEGTSRAQMRGKSGRNVRISAAEGSPPAQAPSPPTRPQAQPAPQATVTRPQARSAAPQARATRPASSRPAPARPASSRPAAARPASNRPAPARPSSSKASERRAERAERAKQKRGSRPLTDAMRAKLQAAEDLAGQLKEKSYYELLGVPQEVNDQDLKRAFRVLARDYHLDRYKRFDITEAQRKVIQQVFIAINRAHEILSDPEQRAEYDAGLQMGHKTAQRPKDAKAEMERVFKAEKLVRDALRLLGNSSYANALSKLEEALALTPNDALGQAAHAYAHFMVVNSKGGSPQVAAMTIETLLKITEEMEGRYEPYLYLGRVYRVMEQYEKAIAALTKATEISRHIPELKSELRHVQRKLEEASSKRKSFFGRKK